MPIIFDEAESVPETPEAQRKRLGRPPIDGEKLDTLIPVKVTPSMYDALDRSAKKRGTNISAITRSIWRNLIAKDDKVAE